MAGLTYKDAGVDIDAADTLVDALGPLAQRASRPEVLGGLGGFGGLFALGTRYRDPILVAGTDGVGTKLKVAFHLGRHDTVGIDLVAMCVNDVLVTGAEPLFFLDYFATGKLDVEQGLAVVRGIAEGCRQAGCALLGGETAEMPGFYPGGEYDLAGFCVGVVERDALLSGERVVEGDVLVGVASSGLHSNGFSLSHRAAAALELDLGDRPEALGGATLGETLLAPTRIYARAALGLRGVAEVRSMAHITGGGLPGNLPRSLPASLAGRLDARRWTRPAVFDLLASAGIEEDEMFRTFNMGLGLVLVVAPGDAEAAVQALENAGETASVVGEVVRRVDDAAVVIEGLS